VISLRGTVEVKGDGAVFPGVRSTTAPPTCRSPALTESEELGLEIQLGEQGVVEVRSRDAPSSGVEFVGVPSAVDTRLGSFISATPRRLI
jgi:hypothetical protein